MDSFNTYQPHIHGNVYLSSSPTLKQITTLGQDDLIVFWNTDDLSNKKQLELPNQMSQQYTCISASPQENVVALGTRTGKVFLVSIENPSNQEIVYRGSGSINGVQFTESGDLLAISAEQAYGVIYSRKEKKFHRCKKGHDGLITNTHFTKDEQYFFTTGTDGYVNVYNFIHGEPQVRDSEIIHLSRYRISAGSIKDKRISICSRPIEGYHLSFGGSTTLQQIFIEEKQTDYKLKVSIHEGEQISEVCWINTNVIVLGTSSLISIWNYNKGVKLMSLKQEGILRIVSNGKTFFASNSNGNFLQFKDKQIIQKLESEATENDQQQQEEEEKIQQIQVQEVQQKKPKKKKQKPELSKAAYLITVYPQTALESRYEGYLQNRFIFYNQYGCVIERSDGNDSLIELQYHDKSKIRRIRFQSTNKYICYFALSKDCFAYSSLTHFFVQYEGYNRTKNDRNVVQSQYYLEKWDYKWDSIQGIAIGNSWIAVANDEQIKFFDFLGNQLYSICVDRKFMAIVAYEDIFVIVFHSAIPNGGSQMFQMKVYTINESECKFERKALLPVKTGELINWIGFSQEGMLFVQDTNETIRFYSWNKNQWISVYSGDKTQIRVYVQHIQHYELYGFKIQQKEGLPVGPTVLPRSLPRKINLQLSEPSLDFISPDQNFRLKRVAMKKYIYEHEKFRYQRWYKFKYSRRKDNPLYEQTINILSNEELGLTLSQNDIQIVEYMKKLQAKLKIEFSDRQNEIKHKLIYLCSNFVNSWETVKKIKQILNITDNLLELKGKEYEIDCKIQSKKKAIKYSGIKRLNKLVDMGWQKQ